MPFNRGLSSPSCLLAGSIGANRRGRAGWAIELVAVAAPRDTQIRERNPGAVIKVLRCVEALIKPALMIVRLCKCPVFGVWGELSHAYAQTPVATASIQKHARSFYSITFASHSCEPLLEAAT